MEQISDEEIIATTSDGALLHIKPDTNGKHLPWQVSQNRNENQKEASPSHEWVRFGWDGMLCD